MDDEILTTAVPESGGTAGSGGEVSVRVPGTRRSEPEETETTRNPIENPAGNPVESTAPAAEPSASDGTPQLPETFAAVSAVESGGDLILTGPMTVQAAGADGKTAVIVTEKVTVSGVREYGENWTVSGGEAAPGRRILLTGGTLEQQEDGSVLITGVTGGPVTVNMAPQSETALVEYAGEIQAERAAGHPLLSALLFVVCVFGVLLLMQALHRLKHGGQEVPEPDTGEPARPAPALGLSSGKLHHIGKRPSQQDSLTVEQVSGGVFAAVADGMGGLADGDKVSQTVIYTLLNAVSGRSAAEIGENLLPMVSDANAAVNQMLGFSARYKSGSTLVAVAAEPDRFRWISVGDSHIYLYRAGLLLRLNREHVFETDLLTQAVNREISFAEARSHPKRGGLTSFIGMGDLRYVDRSPGAVPAARGDRVLLMSDGVYNTLPEEEITRILAAYPEAAAAAAAMEAAVLERNNPHQDNFTAVILDYV